MTTKKLLLHPIGSELDAVLSYEEMNDNLAAIAEREALLSEHVEKVHHGWGERYVERVHAKGKLTTWERIERLKDSGSPVFEVGTLVNLGVEFQGSRRPAPGAGVVTAFVRVQDRWCVVIANDNTVASGAWWPRTPEKIERAQEMALRLRLPVIYLVDCSGLFLPEQSRSFPGRTGAGHIFTQNARLADAGVPQLAGVFGDCIAGGGYMPIISDRVVMTERAYMVIAGAALVRGAKSKKLTSLDIGGPEVHVHQSRAADLRVPDDPTAIAVLRDEIAKLPGSAVPFYRYGAHPSAPRFDPAEIGALFPRDPRRSYPIEQVLARLVDDSLFHEMFAGLGREMLVGLGRVDGLWMGFVANRQGLIDEPGIGKRPGGVLYREGIAKISQFARACAADGIPLVWLQDVGGFDIGVEAERLGLLGYGGNLIYTNATHPIPFFTILLRKASGAGYYAMSGMPYEPVIQLSTPLTRLAVMEGRTLAIAAYNSKLDDDFQIATTDPEERKAIEEGMAKTAARIEADMDPFAAASRMDTDEVVPFGQLRAWLELMAQTAYQSIGYRRTKNPRIWSMHDLNVLAGLPHPEQQLLLVRSGDALLCPTVGTIRSCLPAGTALKPGQTLAVLERAERPVALVVPEGVRGFTVGEASGWVQAGDPICTVGRAEVGDAPPEAAPTDRPDGTLAIRADTDGTFYARPEPKAPPFVRLGDTVVPQQTLGLVEVMKTFSAVRAPQAGIVRRIVVEEGASVSAGDTLFWLQPT